MEQDLIYDDIVAAVRKLTDHNKDNVKEWLKKNLGEKYNDSIDTIVVYAKESKSEYIGKYTIITSPYVEKGKLICFNKDAMKVPIKPFKNPDLMIIDDPIAPHRSEIR